MSDNVYRNYTSTSVLSGVDVKKFTAWSHLYFKKFILPHLPQNREARLLEVGCGYGRYTGLLTNELGFQNTLGVDISEEQIQYAKDNLHLHNVLCQDAVEYLRDKKACYDVVILMDVLEHLELPVAIELLKLIRTSLSAGGKLIIQVPNGLSPMQPIFHGDVTHVRAFSVNSMSQILRMAGYSEFYHMPLPPFVHSVKSLARWILWRLLVNPILYILVVLSHGNPVGGIYTSNLLTIAHQTRQGQ